ncbi:MAG: 6-phosphogluconolactonase [Vicinamibacteria bacterium]|nr:6-phosphogluconolactonase [Vicinamibacteria bacterium]
MAHELARRFRTALNAARANGHGASFALTGGASARLYPALRSAISDWSDIEIFWSDERAVPPDHPDSNFRAAGEPLLDLIAIPAENVHRMPADENDLDAAASRYERILPPRFDLIHLGMGSDGHVGSLFPDHALLAEKHRRVRAVEDAPKPPPRRLTLTMPVLHRARAIVLTVIGAEKARAAHEALENSRSSLPAALLARGPAPTTMLLDVSAATHLTL